MPSIVPKTIVLFSCIKGHELYIPLNLLTLASYLTANGFRCVIIDGQVTDDWESELVEALNCSEIVSFLISTYTGRSIQPALEAARICRELDKDIPIFFGGYHASLVQKKLIQEGYADFVVRGYGERAVLQTISAIKERDKSKISNLVWKNGDEIVSNPRGNILEMNELPSIDYNLIKVQDYFTDSRKVVHYISSYGCPYACTFCAEPEHSQRRWKGKPIETIVDDVAGIFKQYKCDRVSFVDPNASSNPWKFIELCQAFAKSDISFAINCNMRARDVLLFAAKSHISLLEEAGIKRVFLGVESGSNSQLYKLKKSSTAEDHLQAVKLLDSAGIEVQISFIHDLPSETNEEAFETLKIAEQMMDLKTEGSIQTHHFYMPFPGTELSLELMQSRDIEIENIPQLEWSKSSTFSGNDIWQGNKSRRELVIEHLWKLHRRNPSIVSHSQVARLERTAGPGHNVFNSVF